MPIKGLTDNSSYDSRPPIDIAVFKGDRKTDPKRPGKDLGTLLRVRTSNKIARAALLNSMSGCGKPDSNGDLVVEKINVYFPYNTAEKVFPTAMKLFDASSFRLACDRHTIYQEKVEVKDENGDSWSRIENTDKPCPLRDNPEVWKCPNGCSKNGELLFYVRELADIDMMLLSRLTTHGFEDISRISHQLRHWEGVFGSLAASPFPCPQTRFYIPFVLQRVEVPVKRPVLTGKEDGYKRTGKKAEGTTGALDIYPDPEWMKLYGLFQQHEFAQKMGLKASMQAIARLVGSDFIDAEAVPVASLPPAKDEREAFYKEIAQLRQKLEISKDSLREICQGEYGKSSAAEMSVEELRSLLDKLKDLEGKSTEDEF